MPARAISASSSPTAEAISRKRSVTPRPKCSRRLHATCTRHESPCPVTTRVSHLIYWPCLLRPAYPKQPKRSRRRGPKPDRRRTLELLAASRDGCAQAILIAHGFSIEQMVELVRDGLATAHRQRVIVGKRTIEVARMKITEAGRQALTDKPKR